MKIGDVSKETGISIDTIRYYIKIGLIVPNKSTYQYIFNDQDVEEFILISKLKNLNFHLDEIHKIISLYRTSYLNVDREVNQYIEFLKNKKSSLNDEIQQLKESVYEIEQLMEQAHNNLTTDFRTSGINVCFLDMLVCNECNSQLTLENATIADSEILYGVLKCNCGYEAKIENGILITAKHADNTSSISFDINSTLLSEYSADTISAWKKEMHSLLMDIKANDLKNKVILETNIKRLFFLFKNMSQLDDNAKYIITESNPEAIKFYKSQIDRLNIKRKILFIASEGHKYPLRKPCIDIWIDYADSNENMENDPDILPKILTKYFKQGTKVYGTFVATPSNAPYIDDLRRAYPKVNIQDYVDNKFFELMEQSGYKITHRQFTRDIWEYSKQSGINIVDVPSKMIKYHAIYKDFNNI